MMNDFFETKKSICDYCAQEDVTGSLLCVDTCPENALKLVDMEPDIDHHIYQLNEHVLIKDHPWEALAKT